MRAQALPLERIKGVETGGCPHTAIREDASINLKPIEQMKSKYQEKKNSAQTNLFADFGELNLVEPEFPVCENWSKLNQLKKEKDVIGIYISGHPLDDYMDSVKFFSNIKLNDLKNLNPLVDKEVRIAGIIGEVEHKISKNGAQCA